jgi:hypothetical protein
LQAVYYDARYRAEEKEREVSRDSVDGERAAFASSAGGLYSQRQHSYVIQPVAYLRNDLTQPQAAKVRVPL